MQTTLLSWQIKKEKIGISLGKYIWKRNINYIYKKQGIHSSKVLSLEKIQWVMLNNQSDTDLGAILWYAELKGSYIIRWISHKERKEPLVPFLAVC